ncbi:MAG TPA: MBL fold metallo-hydrolase [Vicinamibacterales bacterium]|jgi:metallo-beta-lactamase class B|nr:MBL fold metallo-hydrolase [Vicinamibacterales bacterium]
MARTLLAGLATAVMTAAVVSAQGPPAGRGTGQGRGDAGAGGGRGSANLPTEEQWTNMSPKAKEYVDKAKMIAADDSDLQFDFGVFCKASGGSQNPDRAAVGVPNSEPKLEPFPAPSPAQVIGLQRLFDNFYWIGNTSIGAWLIASNDGYILFDTMNSEDDAKNIIIPGIQKAKLDPMKIKYLVFGHNHFDHTGGGEYIQRVTGAKAVMHRDDWEIYLKSAGRGGGRGRGRGDASADAAAAPPPPPAAPLPKMKRDIDAIDGMTLKVGDITATIFQMTGHTPGSIGMVVPVRYQGRQHPILLVTAATDVHNRESFVGGYEHIWDEAIKMKVENVMQAHPNTNMNLLARTKYVNDHYPPAKNPLLYGAARTERYINIMRNCTLARMEVLGW